MISCFAIIPENVFKRTISSTELNFPLFYIIPNINSTKSDALNFQIILKSSNLSMDIDFNTCI